MKSCEVVVDYYDALFNNKTRSNNTVFSIHTLNKMRRILTQGILQDASGTSYFLKHIKPETHMITGFYKPWEWYTTFKDYPDVLEYILLTYYEAEYFNKSKNDARVNSQRVTLPFTKTNGNQFINLYDSNELLQVRTFTDYLINNELFQCTGLITTLAYIHALTGSPKTAFTLYKVLHDADDSRINKSPRVQDCFSAFIEGMFRDLTYALETKYTHGLLTRNIMYSANADGNALKSVRMLLDMIIKHLGYKSIFEENLTYRKLISNLPKYGEYLDGGSNNIFIVHNNELCGLIPVTFEYLSILSSLSDKITVPNNKDLRRSINSGNHIITNDDSIELNKLYAMNKEQREDLIKDVKKTATLLIGL